MELECVSEGVETDEELEVLRKLGCRLAQGYLISMPMSAEQSVRWLEQGGNGLTRDASKRWSERQAST